MRYEKLGRTDIEVSTIAYGCGAPSSSDGATASSEQEAAEAILAAAEAGINLFMAPGGQDRERAEQRLGRAVAGVRDRVLLATHVPAAQFMRKELTAALERSLQNLGVAYIDLYLLDGFNPVVPVEDTLAQLDKFRAEGKIRAYGVANFGREALAKAAASRLPMSAVELPYSLLFRAPEGEVLPFCQKFQVGFLCSQPLMHGLLSGRYESIDELPPERMLSRHFSPSRGGAHKSRGYEKELFQVLSEVREIARDLEEPMADICLSWLTAQKGVASAIAGAHSAVQAKRNARAGDLMLPPGIIDRMNKISRSLKDKLGSSLDPWNEPPRWK